MSSININVNANGIILKSIKNLVTFHFDKKIIKIHIGIVIILAIEKTAVGVIICCIKLLHKVDSFKLMLIRVISALFSN